MLFVIDFTASLSLFSWFSLYSRNLGIKSQRRFTPKSILGSRRLPRQAFRSHFRIISSTRLSNWGSSPRPQGELINIACANFLFLGTPATVQSQVFHGKQVSVHKVASHLPYISCFRVITSGWHISWSALIIQSVKASSQTFGGLLLWWPVSYNISDLHNQSIHFSRWDQCLLTAFYLIYLLPF